MREALERCLMMGGRSKSPEETLQAVEDAAWDARMDGGCHSRTSEILTTMARAMREALASEPKSDGERIEGWAVNSSTVEGLVYFSRTKRWGNATPATINHYTPDPCGAEEGDDG